MKGLKLTRLGGASARNYLVETAAGERYLLKVFPAARHARFVALERNLKALSGTLAVRRAHPGLPLEFPGEDHLYLEWCAGSPVFPDRLSPEELERFARDYLDFSVALQRVEPGAAAYSALSWRERALREAQGSYAARLRKFLDREVPLAELQGEEHRRQVIHGDFHPGNLLFQNGRLAAIGDLEELRPGLPTEDLVRYFVCAAEHLNAHEFHRRRPLLRAFRHLVRLTPYAVEDWIYAIDLNLLRKLTRRTRRGRWGWYRHRVFLFHARFYLEMKRVCREAALGTWLGAQLGGSWTLVPLAVGCAWPVFKATAADGRVIFVKLADPTAAARTLGFLSAVTLPLVPRVVARIEPQFGGSAVLALEWKEAERVDAERMTDAQAASLLQGAVELSAALAQAPAVSPRDETDDPAHQYALIASYARRHPLLGRLLKPLLDIPAEDRTYGERPLAVIHGDLQPKNYGFAGDRLAAVFDFDSLTYGLACEDLAYAFVERARRAELSAAARRRLGELYRRTVAASPWPASDWRFAVNHARLRIAARRLQNHPDSGFIAWDIRRRDRRAAALG